jgi:hypothetical protein
MPATSRAEDRFRVPICGGSPEVIVSDTQALALAVNDTDLFWLDEGSKNFQGSLVRMSKEGGPKQTLVSDLSGPWPLALDATHVYWGADSGGGVMPGTNRIYGYWTSEDSVGRFLKTGQGDETLATVSAGDGAWCTAVDETNVYWTIYIGSVWSVPKVGGVAKALTKEAPNRCLTVDDNYVYVAADDGVRRVRKDGSGDDLITSMGATEIVGDDSNVFWGNPKGIWRWSKR